MSDKPHVKRGSKCDWFLWYGTNLNQRKWKWNIAVEVEVDTNVGQLLNVSTPHSPWCRVEFKPSRTPYKHFLMSHAGKYRIAAGRDGSRKSILSRDGPGLRDVEFVDRSGNAKAIELVSNVDRKQFRRKLREMGKAAQAKFNMLKQQQKGKEEAPGGPGPSPDPEPVQVEAQVQDDSDSDGSMPINYTSGESESESEGMEPTGSESEGMDPPSDDYVRGVEKIRGVLDWRKVHAKAKLCPPCTKLLAEMETVGAMFEPTEGQNDASVDRLLVKVHRPKVLGIVQRCKDHECGGMRKTACALGRFLSY